MQMKDIIPYTNSAMDQAQKIQQRMAEEKHKSSAEYAISVIISEARKFEAKLDEDHEVGARLSSFGSSVLIHIRTLSAENPNIVIIDGLNENNEPVRLVQHFSQLSTLFVAVKKLKETPHRIGF
jgi:hypothetical protein